MKKNRLLILSAATLLLIGCNLTIHEDPDGFGVDLTEIDANIGFTFDDQMLPLPASITRTSERAPAAFQARFIVEIYVQNEEGNISSTPFKRIVTNEYDFIHHGLSTVKLKTPLAAVKYKVLVWVDYVRLGGNEDYHFNTNSLRAITVNNTETTFNKDAYFGNFNVDLTQYRNQKSIKVTQVIPMKRPFAQLQFITEDIEKYASKVGQRSSSIVDNIGVRVEYTSYFPTAFDLVQARNTSSVMGMRYSANLAQLSDTEALVGADYIFASEVVSYVRADLIFYDLTTKAIINRASVSKNIPLKCGYITTVRGDFLTTTTNPGVVIDTDWDGDIIVPIHD